MYPSVAVVWQLQCIALHSMSSQFTSTHKDQEYYSCKAKVYTLSQCTQWQIYKAHAMKLGLTEILWFWLFLHPNDRAFCLTLLIGLCAIPQWASLNGSTHEDFLYYVFVLSDQWRSKEEGSEEWCTRWCSTMYLDPILTLCVSAWCHWRKTSHVVTIQAISRPWNVTM